MECVRDNIISRRDRACGNRYVRRGGERWRDGDILLRRKTFRAKEIDSLVRVELAAGIELINNPRSGAIQGDDHRFRCCVGARAERGENQKTDRSAFLGGFASGVVRFLGHAPDQSSGP